MNMLQQSMKKRNNSVVRPVQWPWFEPYVSTINKVMQLVWFVNKSFGIPEFLLMCVRYKRNRGSLWVGPSHNNFILLVFLKAQEYVSRSARRINCYGVTISLHWILAFCYREREALQRDWKNPKLALQMSHLNGSFPSWTVAMCPFIT